MTGRVIPTDFLAAAPDGWTLILLTDGSPAYERPADHRDSFACIDDEGLEYVIAATAEEAMRVDAERST